MEIFVWTGLNGSIETFIRYLVVQQGEKGGREFR